MANETYTGRQVNRSTLVYLFTCLLLYFLIGLQYAALTPAWQVPDEPAHYNFIKHLAQNFALPELKTGDYDQNYLGQLTSQKFPPELSIDSVRYESWQPPLYYILATPIFILFNGALLPLRIFSLLLGAGVLIFAYLAIKEAVSPSPTSDLLPLIAVSFIAFIPQHIAIMAGVNNDSLSELIIAIGLWRILAISNQQSALSNLSFVIRHLSLGFIIGLAFITKSHAYLLAPVAFVMLLTRANIKSLIPNLQSLTFFLQSLALVFVPALLIGSTFWGRNLAVYGFPDFMATIRHDSVVIGQPRTSEWLAQYGTVEVLRRFFQTTFQSFWGQFGWMGVVMDQRVYMALLMFTAMLAIGFVLTLRFSLSATNQQPLFNPQSLLLLVSALLTLALYLYYNLNYVQYQGRYLFPALIPLSYAVSLSLTAWADLFKFLGEKRKWLAFVPSVLLALLSVLALYRFILPMLK